MSHWPPKLLLSSSLQRGRVDPINQKVQANPAAVKLLCARNFFQAHWEAPSEIPRLIADPERLRVPTQVALLDQAAIVLNDECLSRAILDEGWPVGIVFRSCRTLERLIRLTPVRIGRICNGRVSPDPHVGPRLACVISATVPNYCEMAPSKTDFFVVCVGRQMGGVMKSPVVKRSIVLAGHKTSVSLEDAFWRGLKEIAGKRVMSLSDLVGTIDSQRQQGNLSSALRLFVLEFYRSQIPDRKSSEGLGQTTDRPNPLPS